MHSSPWRRRFVFFAWFTAAGLIMFGYRYLDVVARQGHEPFAIKLIEELSSAYGSLLLLPLVIRYARWARTRAGSRVTLGLLHVPGLMGFSLLHTTWNAIMRGLAFPLAGLGPYDYGMMRFRYPMEFMAHILVYTAAVSIIYLLDSYREANARALRVARLEAELSAARLQGLQRQLHPHFLFNALNTVSSVMYDDVAQADRMLTLLGDLLRNSLSTQDAPEIMLGDELSLLDRYLEIMRARFADRLDVRVEVEPGVRNAAVPQLLLQPLVENALHHGDPGAGREASVTVRARRVNGRLRLEVQDNGPGPAPAMGTAAGNGIGLSNTRRRLATLYGEDQLLSLEPAPGGGCLASVELPYRELSGRT